MDRPAAPDAVAAATLSAAVSRLIGVDATGKDHFGIAVSGGADSLGLLILAHTAFPGRIAAATVDHGLRSESRDEAEWVAQRCAALSIPHMILHPDRPITGSLQAEARAARYATLEQWRRNLNLDWVLTAHHADDQLETIAMRLNRSSGVSGLAGIRGRQGRVLRPLLHVRRRAILELVRSSGTAWIEDPSNTDHRFDRARIRAALKDSPVDPVAAAHSADHLAEAEAALTWSAHRLAAERIILSAQTVTLDTRDIPGELLRRLVLHAVEQLVAGSADSIRGDALTAALDAARLGKKVSIGAFLIAPDARARHLWQISNAPPRRTG